MGSSKSMNNRHMPPKSNLELKARYSESCGKIVVYAIALFVGQVAIGYFEGSFAPSVTRLLGSAAATFVVCSVIFAHLAARQPSLPYIHAWSALLLQASAGALLAHVLLVEPHSPHYVLVALDWSALIGALVVGTVLGGSLRHRSVLRAQQSVEPDRREDAAPG